MYADKSKPLNQLSENMEMVGPGHMLSEARKSLSITVEEVAKKLNFRVSLVENIERDYFDHQLPPTYNRGYLRSYAKFINVDINKVLNAYDTLGGAQVESSKMQSFSNFTEKQTEHSRIMWLSYIIAAILLGLIVLWWQQEPKQGVEESAPQDDTVPALSSELSSETLEEPPVLSTVNGDANTATMSDDKGDVAVTEDNLIKSENLDIIKPETIASPVNTEAEVASEDFVDNAQETNNIASDENAQVNTAVFTFSGDCWVNIFDANGERIAWGVKKSGYVMNVTGQPPLQVTLGKPELASIEFNGQAVDMSGFNVGNIAKFSLPM